MALRTRRTSIDDLAAFGNEAADEHLALAAGGMPNLRITKLPDAKSTRQWVSDGATCFDYSYDY
jgi:hypothetical protein